MSADTNIEFLEKLLSTPSPVGYETAGQQVWLDFIKPFSDEITTDVYGSAAASLKVSDDAITVMLEAHCDEIGMVVQYIDSDGFVYINRLGGSDAGIARAKKVFIHTSKGIVSGVIGNTAIHLQDRANRKLPTWKDLFIDIGAENKEEAQQMVRVGDPVTFTEDLEFITDDLITARALDNRIGSYIIACALQKLSSQKDKLKVNVVAVNSVQEEIGGYGARMMSYRLKPNVAIVTDVTHATDTPGVDNKEHGEVKLGKGPAVTHGTANQIKLVDFLIQTAEKSEIPVQHEASSIRTGTDTDSIFYSGTGIASALVSTPMRYMHSPVEMVSLQDATRVSELMVQAVLRMNAKQSFELF